MKLFSLERINTSNAIFDMKKLEWMNGEYLRTMDLPKLLEVFQEWLRFQKIELPAQYSSPDFLSKALPLIAERSRTLAEVYDALLPYLSDELTYDEEGLKKHFRKDPEAVKRWLLLYRERLEKLHEFNKETAEGVLRELVEELGIKPGLVIHPVRVAVTGRTVGPPLFDCLELLGRERVLDRLHNLPE